MSRHFVKKKNWRKLYKPSISLSVLSTDLSLPLIFVCLYLLISPPASGIYVGGISQWTRQRSQIRTRSASVKTSFAERLPLMDCWLWDTTPLFANLTGKKSPSYTAATVSLSLKLCFFVLQKSVSSVWLLGNMLTLPKKKKNVILLFGCQENGGNEKRTNPGFCRAINKKYLNSIDKDKKKVFATFEQKRKSSLIEYIQIEAQERCPPMAPANVLSKS